MDRSLCIGIDYGTDSMRAVLVGADNGEEFASFVFEYPRWENGLYCDPVQNRFRQHPLDYIEGIENTVKNILTNVPGSAEQVAAIPIDTTGFTPAPADKNGIPLALFRGFEEDPDAMFAPWRDHTSINEADRINDLCREWETGYFKYSGGVYSSEWFWAKTPHVLGGNERVAEAAVSWVEHCDRMPALLTGNTDPVKMKRNRCAAGHKAMWHKGWGELPPAGFWAEPSRYPGKFPPGNTDLVALDWLNGRRTPDANPHLKRAIAGLTLGSGAPAIFRALEEATAFGSKLIADSFRDQGIWIKGILVLGGVARKSPFVMQVLSNVMNRPIRAVRSEYTCALGVAMYAAVVAGLHSDISYAQEKMGKGFEKEYHPVPANVEMYAGLFRKYQAFGTYVEENTK